MKTILLPAPGYGKSSRGTPRLRRLPRTLHGAARLAALTATLDSWPRFLACAQDAQPELTFLLTQLGADMLASSMLPHSLSASCGVLVSLDWPAFTPALTEFNLLVALGRLAGSSQRMAPSGYSRLGRVVAVRFTALAPLILLAHHRVFL